VKIRVIGKKRRNGENAGIEKKTRKLPEFLFGALEKVTLLGIDFSSAKTSFGYIEFL
jgi:hypothetical protein